MTLPAGQVVLVVEDDEGIGSGLVRALTGQGYPCRWCRSGRDALGVPAGDIGLVLLDLGLPDIDGVDLCRGLRQSLPATPILILTARGSEADVVVGLDAGADDYLVKPFRLAELFARLRAHLRRLPAAPATPGVLEVGDLTLDEQARRVTVDGKPVELRAKEFDLLAVLMRSAGRVVTRDEAMRTVWDAHWHGSTKTLDVHIAALRARLGETGPSGSRISTLRGVGYRLEVPPAEPG